MSEIRVNPVSIRSYGTKAQDLFGQIRVELEGLVDDAVGVQFYGPNAKDFKVGCGTMASTFAADLTKDLASIAGTVQTSTTNISRSLGGVPVTIQFEGGTVKVPDVPAGDGSVGINVEALSGLKTASNGRFANIAQALATNLTTLTSTDWTGNAKTQAVSGVASYTTKAKTTVEQAKTALANRIDTQIEQAKLADQS